MIRFLKKVRDTVGMWLMVIPFLLLPVILLILGISETVHEHGNPKVSDIDVAYSDGYDNGYYNGIERAKDYLAFVVDDDLSSIARDIEDEYGLHPEEALQLLSNYADVPAEVDEEELNDAIWAIYRYYYDSHKIINGIEDYDID